jgi:hypothetical protein
MNTNHTNPPNTTTPRGIAHSQNATWHHFTPEWVEATFGHRVEIAKTFPDILVTVFK